MVLCGRSWYFIVLVLVSDCPIAAPAPLASPDPQMGISSGMNPKTPAPAAGERTSPLYQASRWPASQSRMGRRRPHSHQGEDFIALAQYSMKAEDFAAAACAPDVTIARDSENCRSAHIRLHLVYIESMV